MNTILRHLALARDTALYGPSFGVINYLIRSPRPLDPDWAWHYVTRPFPWLEDWARMNLPPAAVRGWLLRRFLRPAHEVGIAEHYDVSNEFYELFLDRKYMLYSCADYRTGAETLEEAQANKVRFILDLVDPQPGEEILELGCGWGGILNEVAGRTGEPERAHGYTISREQVAYNVEHRGLQVEFKNFITEELPHEAFDKIYSVGAWEHVRPNDLRPTLDKLYRALKPGGRMVTHFFCGTAPGVPAAGLVGQIFFPGSATPPYAEQLRTAQAAGFRVAHQSLHDTYPQTLRHWFERLVAQRERAIELVGVETYNKYLLFFPCSWRYFHEVQAVLLRIVLEKPRRCPRRVPVARGESLATAGIASD